jgi:hypothetical protein
MLTQQQIHTVLWSIPIFLQSVVATVMMVRGLHRRLPYFFSYTSYVVLSNMALMGVYSYYRQAYYNGYWIQELISWALGFAVIYEIYASLLKEYSALQKAGTFVFWLIGVALFAIALWTAFSSPGSDVSRLTQTLLTLERSVRIVEWGLLVALFAFASVFGLSWKNHLFGIALGFAIFLSMQLAVVAIRAYTGERLNALFSWLQSISYNVGVLVWAFYFIRPWRTEDLRLLPKTQLAEWNETLQELLHR